MNEYNPIFNETTYPTNTAYTSIIKRVIRKVIIVWIEDISERHSNYKYWIKKFNNIINELDKMDRKMQLKYKKIRKKEEKETILRIEDIKTTFEDKNEYLFQKEEWDGKFEKRFIRYEGYEEEHIEWCVPNTDFGRLVCSCIHAISAKKGNGQYPNISFQMTYITKCLVPIQ